MTAQVEMVHEQEPQKQNDKEFNFRQQQASYEKKLADEKSHNERLEREIQELRTAREAQSDDENSEPYMDHKRYKKEQDCIWRHENR